MISLPKYMISLHKYMISLHKYMISLPKYVGYVPERPFSKKAVEKAANKKNLNPIKFYDWSIHGRFGNGRFGNGLSGMIPSMLSPPPKFE